MPELPTHFTLPEGTVPPERPATPKDAATVMLLRDGSDSIEVFLLRRVTGMAFAGGMTVFPGGGVDQRDAEASIAWVGPSADEWARRFDCSPRVARALVCAAVRETFEESGVLLAGTDEAGVVGDTAQYADARESLVQREISLAEFLDKAGLVLRADLLRPWANWLTPEVEARRYDTRFFVAKLPTGQRADGVTSEADHVTWRSPADALADWRAGQCRLLPPTWTTLAELTEFDTVAEAMAARRSISKLMPKVVPDGDKLRVVLPGAPEYERAASHLDPPPAPPANS